jgi:hypothetical protein
MNKYTKGPWVIDWYGCTSGNGKTHWRVPRSIGPISPDHDHWSGPYLDVEEPDAYLIAAAPDLLEALEKAVNRQGFSNDELIAAREVINKAKNIVKNS